LPDPFAPPLGMPQGTVVLLPYDDRWPAAFAAEATRIWPLVSAHALDIQHIGSTAVPGLAAKPGLDIALAVDTDEAVAICREALTSLGYEFYDAEANGPGHSYFIRGRQVRTHQAHIWRLPTYGWDDHLYLRDRLRADPSLAAAYAALKQTLARTHASDKAAYTEAKTEFVQAVLHSRQSGSIGP